MAMDHQNKILKNGICSVPMPKIHYVAFETNAQYIPRATILHRCDESTGCCDAEFACVAKTEETVELAFIVVVNYRREEPRLIKMVNHTECECRRQSERSKRSTSCLCPLHFTDFSGPEPETQKGKGISTKLATEHRCRCDCHLSDDICKRLKNGEEGFSLEERLRIKHGESSPPFCNYGPYDMDNGRCPRPKNHQSHQIQFQSKRQHGRS
ncbi:hypothetical protein KR009_001135 [Drosophila setifemur]|nr:hypothetical protein KR009_001135 [Drosophila setifemur]